MNRAGTNGLLIAEVVSLDDPHSLSRVQVAYTTLDESKSTWARVISVGAGPDQGIRWIPEIGDQVLVAWVDSDSRWPVVLGGMWSDKALPPLGDASAIPNNIRSITSRSGHQLILDDAESAERIEIRDSSGQLELVMDSSGRSITLRAGQATIEMTASGTINIRGTQINLN